MDAVLTGKPVLSAWLDQARKAAAHYWAFEGLVDENPEEMQRAYERGDDPYAYIKELGQDLDLHEFGPAFGGW